MQAFCQGIRLKFSDVEHLNTAKLEEWIEERKQNKTGRKKLLLLDTRQEEEYNVSHMEDSILVSPSATDDQIKTIMKENIKKITGEDTSGQEVEVICYCSLGYRSSNLARKINRLKSEMDIPLNVYNLDGSIIKWANEGRPMVSKNGQLTKFAHPYNAVFGALLNSDIRKYNIEEAS